MDILKLYLPLCWFKSHPLQLPSSVSFFQKNLIFYFTLWVIVQANMITVLEAVIEVSIETVLTLAFIAIVLGVNRTLHSYIQVATAILVTKNIVSAISIPVIGWLAVTHDWLSYLLLTGLMAWDFALIAYIMKKVLLIDNFASLIVAFFYLIGTFGIAYSLTSLIV